jgi:hypothetical protein
MSDEVELLACASCSSDYRPDELATTPNGDMLCSDCRIYCDRCEEYRWEDGSRHVEGVGIYCESCADNYTFWCESCESTYSEFNDHYMNLIMKSAGCQKEDIAKVIKKLVKEIVIIKQ